MRLADVGRGTRFNARDKDNNRVHRCGPFTVTKATATMVQAADDQGEEYKFSTRKWKIEAVYTAR